MASSKGGFRNTNKRAKKHAAMVKTLNRKRNQEGTAKKRGTING
jgi:hypothetical protein